MSNIKTLSEAASYLKNEFINEIDNQTQFKNAEVEELASIITRVFSEFEEEVNGEKK